MNTKQYYNDRLQSFTMDELGAMIKDAYRRSQNSPRWDSMTERQQWAIICRHAFFNGLREGLHVVDSMEQAEG